MSQSSGLVGVSASTEAVSLRVSSLYRKFGATIYSRCRRLLRDEALAEDATQDVFVRVLKHLDRAPDDAAVLGWIYRISTNYCLNLLRDRAGQAQSMAPDTLPDVEAGNPERLLLDRQAVMQLIERAPPKLQPTAVLFFVDGRDHDQVAAALGISRRTVINRLNDFVARSKKFVAVPKARPAPLGSTTSPGARA